MSLVVIASLLFAIGLYGVFTRREIVIMLACIEIMLGAALLLAVGLASIAAPVPTGSAAGGSVEAFGLIVLVVAAAEAAVGMSLALRLGRDDGIVRSDDIQEVQE